MIEIARAMGATVIAVTRSAAKRGSLFETGAHHVVVAPDGVDFSGDVSKHCGGRSSGCTSRSALDSRGRFR
ncbi:MAG: hypothetical protein A3G24_24860 [Betaproteobacteria bacterium RIFCSPLOWO2_12_FULL_62_13]|nr:MAG: hypothetical protein A3G24_24860 [Betaproteobacteria bacterium RIFCSPLOWO2_12_FULL_62_13]